MIGLAFELQDSHPSHITAQTASRRGFRTISTPSVFDAFMYYYNLCGLFTGPYYSFKTHTDCMNNENVIRLPVYCNFMQIILAGCPRGFVEIGDGSRVYSPLSRRADVFPT